MNGNGVETLRFALVHHTPFFIKIGADACDDDSLVDTPSPEATQDRGPSIFMNIKMLEAQWKRNAELRKIAAEASSIEIQAQASAQIEVIESSIREGMIATDSLVNQQMEKIDEGEAFQTIRVPTPIGGGKEN